MIHVLDRNGTPQDALRAIAQSEVHEGAFYILDVGDIIHKHTEWKIKLPRVQPFYAVKCNGSQLVLSVLAALGTGFDCASKNEIAKVTDLGVDPSRIIYANPTKAASHIRTAVAASVDTMTFDNECELHKVKSLYPNTKMVLRIRSDDSQCTLTLGDKFGCDVKTEAEPLLMLAVELGINVIGVSLHVGTGYVEPQAFRQAITEARHIFDLGLSLGLPMKVLDLGGGFPGHDEDAFDQIAKTVNTALDELFPASSGVQVIAEPGRYYVASAFTLATQIHSRRHHVLHQRWCLRLVQLHPLRSCCRLPKAARGIPFLEVMQMLNWADVQWAHGLSSNKTGKLRESSLWGPTCDSVDRVLKSVLLPPLEIGDWLVFENMGAYTLSAATTFNGFSTPKVHTVIDKSNWYFLKDRLPLTEELFSLQNITALLPNPSTHTTSTSSSPDLSE